MIGVVDKEGVRRMVAQHRAQLVEVLPHDEFHWAHLPGARSVPLSDLDSGAAELDRRRPVIVYCHDSL